MDQIKAWLSRKEKAGFRQVKSQLKIDFEYHQHVGPRMIYGKVQLSVGPANEFVFVSYAKWPVENYDNFVIDGILDALVGINRELPAGKFELIEIGWHEIDSAAIGYYHAAKYAAMSLKG